MLPLGCHGKHELGTRNDSTFANKNECFFISFAMKMEMKKKMRMKMKGENLAKQNSIERVLLALLMIVIMIRRR